MTLNILYQLYFDSQILNVMITIILQKCSTEVVKAEFENK